MAKDRARDPKRTINLGVGKLGGGGGLSDPISHVKTHANLDNEPSTWDRTTLRGAKRRSSKLDSDKWTDQQRHAFSKEDENKAYDTAGEGGRWKINSSPNKPSEHKD